MRFSPKVLAALLRRSSSSWAALFVTAFILLFVIFYLCGCSYAPSERITERNISVASPGMLFPSSPDTNRTNPDPPIFPAGAPKDKLRQHLDADSSPAFPRSIPPEQRSGKDGMLEQSSNRFRELSGASAAASSASAKGNADGIKAGEAADETPGNEEDWNRRCYLFPENSLDRPEFCRRLSRTVVPQLFRDTGIPVSGQTRR